VAQHGLDGDVAKVLILGNEQNRESVGVKLQHLASLTKPRKRIRGSLPASLRNSASSSPEPAINSGTSPEKTLHGADNEIDSLPAMQTAGQQEVLPARRSNGPALYRRIKHFGIEAVVEL